MRRSSSPGGCVVTCLSYRSVAREKVAKPPEGHEGPQRTDSSVPALEEWQLLGVPRLRGEGRFMAFQSLSHFSGSRLSPECAGLAVVGLPLLRELWLLENALVIVIWAWSSAPSILFLPNHPLFPCYLTPGFCSEPLSDSALGVFHHLPQNFSSPQHFAD